MLWQAFMLVYGSMSIFLRLHNIFLKHIDTFTFKNKFPFFINICLIQEVQITKIIKDNWIFHLKRNSEKKKKNQWRTVGKIIIFWKLTSKICISIDITIKKSSG